MLGEVGLSIGLANYNGAPAIMNTTHPGGVNQLLASDSHGAAALYGPAVIYGTEQADVLTGNRLAIQ